ncbi:putative fungistatic metabolite [Cladorrhinum samala]|uniref:Fungistatic metabolite n=1 Tax=Cladorrhinum samala TaxID=585594 RepID=A0AAV9HIZ5_9PEZI|nr:putative fungistatic metabolite [Cladorrhinum samala]
MVTTRSASGLRAVSLLCLVAAAQAAPNLSYKRQAPSFTRDGCFVSNTNGQRVLSKASYAGDAMTVESCAAFCSKYPQFGLEYGRECYCGDASGAEPVSDAECSFPCAGNPDEKCGAGNRADIYTNNLYTPSTPAILDAPYLGCFVDEGARVLPDNLLGDDAMTAQKCATHCADYSYFGVEYGRECWCGNSPPKKEASESECSFPCGGDDTQLCGAGGRINVWGSPKASPEAVGGYEYTGCYIDKLDLRTLKGKVSRESGMTLEKCATFCQGYNHFGATFGTQCFCGNDIEETAVEVAQAECSMRCGGDYDNVCGDANRLNIFSTPQCQPDPKNPATVGGFAYVSCWKDDRDARALDGKVERSSTMTVEKCSAICAGFGYFGVSDSASCFCGNELAGAAAPASECSQLCGGDSTQWCGGDLRLNVYASNST